MSAPHVETPVKKERQGRIHRKPELAKLYPMEMIQQGWQALEALDQFRCMTSSQVGRLLFLDQPTSKGHLRAGAAAHNAANAVCLSRLKDRGFVTVVPSYRREGARKLVRFELNTLTRRGHEALTAYKEERGGSFASRWTPKTPTLADFSLELLPHRLAVTDTIIATEIACRRMGVELALWRDEDQVAELVNSGALGLQDIEPDAMVIIRSGDHLHPLFLEVDRGTESLTGAAANRWERKFHRYQDYLGRGFARDLFFAGCKCPLVLTVTLGGEERLTGLIRATEGAKDRTAYWFTRHTWTDPAKYDFFGSIWLRASDSTAYVSITDELSQP